MTPSISLLKAMYRCMLLARRFDEAQIALYKGGKTTIESVHSYIGQEAVGVGVGFAMRDGDQLVPSLRSRPAFFARGVPADIQWAGVLGRSNSPGKGLTGSRHMAAPEYGIVGTTGIVGAHIPVATGVAMALRIRKQDSVAVCLFGDGAANRGDCHEGMNMAALYKAPVVFVCEANGVAETQEYESYMPIDDLSVRASAYGMPGVRVDGNDVEAVHTATLEAVQRAREGSGPSFIVAETCRIHPHVEGLPDFRNPELMAHWRARDPLVNAERALRTLGGWNDDEMRAVHVSVEAELDDAFEEAKTKPVLDTAELSGLVYIHSREH